MLYNIARYNIDYLDLIWKSTDLMYKSPLVREDIIKRTALQREEVQQRSNVHTFK